MAIVTIDEKQECFFVITQLGERHKNKLKLYDLGESRILVGRKRSQEEPEDEIHPFEFIGGDCSKSNNQEIIVQAQNVKPGEYRVFMDVKFYDPSLWNEFVFRTYSSKKTTIAQTEISENIVGHILLDASIKKGANSVDGNEAL